ncbi:acetylglutamate kinase [Rossellomorea vietnamensis]|uniref:Acetylglutamate kinase n=1 Tax=Rossellomorea vietnamensis TaxID=218284 RepID=A0ACD4C213_9BACI|nr:acetylglutamate kinase [Rossellomorea vietnamensis]UXH42629.1 acetylglutamate kinase [Rossellomorea vietnamensis]WQI94110.1 acetylglutamate kinase [Rossellomorea vietnamensis]
MTTSKSMQVTEHKPVIVVKLGGSIISKLSPRFYKSIKDLQKHYHVILVHGGGPEITATLKERGIQSTFINGQRKTTKDVFNIAEQMLKGKVNSALVHRLNRDGVKAIGLCGYDAQLLEASFIDEESLGLVGKIEEVNLTLLHNLLSLNYLPVIAPLATTVEGERVNVNADLAAAAVAQALKAEKLVFVTDVPGILKDGELVSRVTIEVIQHYIETGVIYGGMIPKVQAALSVLNKDIKEVMIVGCRDSIIQDGEMIGTRMTEGKGVQAI